MSQPSACALTVAIVKLVERALHWIEDRWDARAARLERDEMQRLLTLLCEHLHEHLQQDEPPPRTVINLARLNEKEPEQAEAFHSKAH